MTAKDRAAQLVHKMFDVDKYDDLESPSMQYSHAKKCALIAVDQMMLVLPFNDKHKGLNEYAIQMEKYLVQVRHEIKKL